MFVCSTKQYRTRIMFKVVVLLAFIAVASAVNEADVKFFVYTARQNTVPVEVRKGEFAMVDIDTSKDVKILCHGWVDNHNSFWVAPTKNEYFAAQETNVISVDWSTDAAGGYSVAVGSTKPVAQFIANLIIDLAESRGIKYSQFHLIGHSLGSHIFGFAAKRVFERTGQRVGRITGLDPAGPSFNGNAAIERLDQSDATFVDIIHTDTTITGYKSAIGNVDMWPNGGNSQSGCSALSNCSHLRATHYFYESINSRNFVATQCGSKNDYNNGKCSGNQKTELGERVDKTARGNFYLNTNSKTPFGCNC